MSLISNISDVSFASEYPVDKIVAVYEGSYNKATQTTTRSEPFIGTIYTYAIPHGFTRPVFTNLIWSQDGTNWLDGGATLSGNSSIAFSDSTNVYIATTSNSGTQHYKIILYWIDNYDTTDPLVEPFTTGENKPVFDSRVNFQKVVEEGETSYSPGTFGSATTVTVPHTLGYTPNAKAFFEPISGEVWPLNAGGQSNPFLYSATQDEGFMRIHTNRVDITVNRFSNATRKIWYKIYFDE
jgi:hypothetical protein